MNTAPRERLRSTLAALAAAALACLALPASAQDALDGDAPLPPSSAPDGQGQPLGPETPDSPGDAEAAAQSSGKEGFFHQFIDEEDGKLDFSNFLGGGGFVPIPIIITEPAVDKGFGLAASFITVSPDNPRQVTRRVVGAFKTGNGSKGIGFFQSGYAFDGRLNYRVGIGHGKITLDACPAFAPNGIEYTNHYDYGIVGSALWHLADDRISVGPLFDFRKLRSELDLPGLPEDFAGDFNRTLHTGALGLGLHFDSRDNPLSPTRGINVYAEGKLNRGAFGSDRDYEVYDAQFYAFDKLTSDLRYGVKLELDAIRGDFPAFFAPAINLRGVQAQQYQGMNVLSYELEMTWQLDRRWALLAFGGIGATDAGSRRIFDNSGPVVAGGAGFRYRLARKVGLDAGVDFAYGPGGFVFYLQFGHAWSFGMD
jgi:hypothetical protein